MIKTSPTPSTASPAGEDGGAPMLLSVNVGLPRSVRWNGTTVYTGIHKTPVTGPRTVRRLNVDGDGQGDPDGHGGEQRAVLVYQQGSYDHWSAFLGRDDLTPGSFGENFTVSGLPDDEVCIGDRYRIGTAEFEVTQPRVTCFRVGMRLGVPELPALLVSHGRPGFYLRVVTEGEVSAGDLVLKTRTGHHQLSVAAVDALLYLPGRNAETLRKVVEVTALSPGWRRSFRDLLDGDLATATVAGTTAVDTEPAWAGFRPMTVTRIVQETRTVSSYHLEDHGRERARPAQPGQYLTLRLLDDPDQAPLIRNYSVSAQEGAGRYRITVRRDDHGRAGRFLHDHVEVGDTVDVAAPRGAFVLRPGTSPLLLASAGVGVTPLIAMLRELVGSGRPRPVWWVHVARGRSEHVFATEAERLLEHLPGSRAVIFYTRPGPARPGRGAMTTHQGRPDVDRLGRLGIPSSASAYLCGPPAFVADVAGALRALGIEPGRIRSELFSTLPSLAPGTPDGAPVPPHQPVETGAGPLVTFARSGLSARWRQRDQSLLELAEACAVPARWSCRTGVCHTCATPVISGAASYRPTPLEPPPTGQTLLCCARPTEDMVVDL
ncbi:MOSC domain-containing protein [Promicromonospora sp. CA-289599]|uniref:MOSC domain-containing protein n=1 Tax=Promicromonospora sp. CA-289599 TaxID=3240014 RepID=UPI003D8B2A5B